MWKSQFILKIPQSVDTNHFEIRIEIVNISSGVNPCKVLNIKTEAVSSL